VVIAYQFLWGVWLDMYLNEKINAGLKFLICLFLEILLYEGNKLYYSVFNYVPMFYLLLILI
jgi:hypothetical protein